MIDQTDNSAHSLNHKYLRFVYYLALIFVFSLLGSCNLPFLSQGRGSNLIEEAQLIITANSLKPLGDGNRIELVIVDEVTGIPYSQERIPMSVMEDGSYGAVTQAPIGTVLTYLFHKVTPEGSRILEVGADLQPIRYRLYHVQQPALIIETIAGWEDDLPDSQQAGQITGKIVSTENDEPISDLLVTAGGLQTISDANGSFSLYPIIPGKHTLTVISITGTYQPVQANTETAAGKITPVELDMAPSSWREVTFKLNTPDGTISGAPVRLAGNLAQLGNTFIDLGGGISGDAKQMPILTSLETNQYSLTLLLPVGIDIRYKYTLGDGLWNAEHGLDQSFVTHQLIIPTGNENLEIADSVASWRSSETETIWFEVDVPEFTPESETIGIQFSIAEWMPALPMFRIRDNTWVFPLISPHNFSASIPYRYCRSTPCTGDGQAGIETLAVPRSTATLFSETQLISDNVSGWTYLTPPVGNSTEPEPIQNQRENFSAGLVLTPYLNPTWQPEITTSLANTNTPYNTLVLSPAWVSNSLASPNFFQISIAETPRQNQLISQVEIGHQAGKAIGLYPQVLTPDGPLKWWESLATNQESTWQQFLTEVEDFYYQYANLAAQTNAEILILGGEWLQPALPVGDNFTTYSQPGNIETLWTEIIHGIRDRYPGQIGWVLTLDAAKDPPAFLSEVDILLLQWDYPLEASLTPEEQLSQVEDVLDDIAKPLSDDLGKPVIILIAIPSIQEYNQECIPSPNDEGVCIDLSALKLGPSVENPASTDLESQTAYYHALLSAIVTRDWISGVLAQGTFLGLSLHDSSASIHGKPAEILFQDWITRILEK
jgi:hypothetical protein